MVSQLAKNCMVKGRPSYRMWEGKEEEEGKGKGGGHGDY